MFESTRRYRYPSDAGRVSHILLQPCRGFDLTKSPVIAKLPFLEIPARPPFASTYPGSGNTHANIIEAVTRC